MPPKDNRELLDFRFQVIEEKFADIKANQELASRENKLNFDRVFMELKDMRDNYVPKSDFLEFKRGMEEKNEKQEQEIEKLNNMRIAQGVITTLAA